MSGARKGSLAFLSPWGRYQGPAFGFQKVPAALHTSNTLVASLVVRTVKNQPKMQETQV